jgi:hypothetical protein
VEGSAAKEEAEEGKESGAAGNSSAARYEAELLLSLFTSTAVALCSGGRGHQSE